MNRLFWIISVTCLAAVMLAACSNQEQESPATREPEKPAATAPESTPAAPGSAAELSVTGELRQVDLQAKTFVIKDQNQVDHIFVFAEDTTISGTGGTQGLSTQQGSQATVWYSRLGDQNRAVRVQIATK